MRLAAAALMTAALCGAAPAADIVSEKPEQANVALYHEGYVDTRELMNGNAPDDAFAFVNEVRSVELPAGPSVIRFEGVASSMVPESAHVEGLPTGASSERDFDYDLLSPGSLLARSLGRVVHLVRTDPRTGKETVSDAVVRAASGGAVLEVNGKIEALHCGGPPERLVFDDIPEGLADKPTFSVHATAPLAGRYTIRLSYIAMRMNWSADYVARLSPGGDTLALTGWVTLANFSDTSFADTPVEVIAGGTGTTGDDRAPEAHALASTPQCWPLAVDWSMEAMAALPSQEVMDGLVETVVVTGSRIPQVGLYSSSPVTAVAAQDFADYKLYALPSPTTFAAKQTKQVQFLDQPKVKYQRLYTYRGNPYQNEDEHRPATIRYRMENLDTDGLGKPLPAGSMSVIGTDGRGAPVFLGQDKLYDTPVGLPIAIETGQAPDIDVESKVVGEKSVGDRAKAVKIKNFQVTVRNGKTVPVRFELSWPDRGVATIEAEDRPHILDHGVIAWRFDVPAGGEVAMRYAIGFADGG